MKVVFLDHLVLTVRNIEKTMNWITNFVRPKIRALVSRGSGIDSVGVGAVRLRPYADADLEHAIRAGVKKSTSFDGAFEQHCGLAVHLHRIADLRRCRYVRGSGVLMQKILVRNAAHLEASLADLYEGNRVSHRRTLARSARHEYRRCQTCLLAHNNSGAKG